jgi:hypothetical protein
VLEFLFEVVFQVVFEAVAEGLLEAGYKRTALVLRFPAVRYGLGAGVGFAFGVWWGDRLSGGHRPSLFWISLAVGAVSGVAALRRSREIKRPDPSGAVDTPGPGRRAGRRRILMAGVRRPAPLARPAARRSGRPQRRRRRRHRRGVQPSALTVRPVPVAGHADRRYRRVVAMSESPAGGAAADWCVRCGDTGLVLLTHCPSCGALPLCTRCIVDHIAEIGAQEGRTLGP